MWGNMPYDFGHMIERRAANRGASADFLREVIWAQRVHFPALVVDWHSIVNQFITEFLIDMSTPKLFWVLVEASV